MQPIKRIDLSGVNPFLKDLEDVEINLYDSVYSTMPCEYHGKMTVYGFSYCCGSWMVDVEDWKENDYHFAPQVLVHHPVIVGADKIVICKDDTVFHTETGDEFTVSGFLSGTPKTVCVENDEGAGFVFDAAQLTHTAPVRDNLDTKIDIGDIVRHTADGSVYPVMYTVPSKNLVCVSNHGISKFMDSKSVIVLETSDNKKFHINEQVYDIKGNGPYTILDIEKDGTVRIKESDLDYFLSEFVHEQPDSWERLEEDAANLDEMPCDYSAKDLVRRAKALAERSA